jgi:hypothetical protein
MSEITMLDDDLLFDIDCVYLSSVVVDWEGQSVLLFGREGYGSFQSTTTERIEGSFDEFEAIINVPEVLPMFFRRMVNRAVRWRDCQTPLRVIQARGKMAVVLEDERSWLAIPTVGK